MAERKIKRALIAVYDKTGITEFARALVDEFGIEIISTGGTAKHLKEAGIPVTMVEEVTGFPEMLDGRVKTLHPKIHAGILADRDNPEHMRQLAEHGIKPIDMVVVNLYPFEKTVADPNCTMEQAIEMIDIGGPCMLRAAAKNHKHVLVVSGDPAFHGITLGHLRSWDEDVHRSDALISGAFGAFWETSGYDAKVSEWLIERQLPGESKVKSLRLWCMDRLRYGENPHQSSSYRHVVGDPEMGRLLYDDAPESGREISHNNYVDADAAFALCSELTRAREKLWHRLLVGEVKKKAKQFPSIRKQLETRRNLPHIQRPGATYFLTFRKLQGQLAPEDRDLVMQSCLYADGKQYCLHAAVVMPDHVHLLISPLESHPGEYYQLAEILRGIKGASARRVNERAKTTGSIWQDETFDRIIRDESEFFEKLQYIMANPRTAGIETGVGYPWCVYEKDPGWIKADSAAGIDLAHELAVDSMEHRDWHRLRVGATIQGVPVCLFIKHTNACGVGVADDPIEAYRRAYLGDVNAAMGGILAVNYSVNAEFADAVMHSLDRWGKAAGAGAFFVEVWLAPSFDEDAVKVIRSTKKWGENVRLLAVGDMSVAPDPNALEYKTIAGGMLVQTRDNLGLNEDQWKVVTKRQPTESEMSDLRLSWLIAKHTKSNAISICKDGMLIGNGAGQMSRVMSCRIATWLAKENGHAEKLAGSAAASDAFFPFRDGPDILMDAGVTALIQPGGSKRDEDTIKACDERGVAMIFTGTRHFKH